MRAGVGASLCLGAVALTTACAGCSSNGVGQIELGNPYENVDWRTFAHHKADLHLHTLQSDGCHLPNEVVRVFHEAGFSVLSLTDHDAMAPNQCPLRDALTPGQIAVGFFADEPTPYPAPRPPNFPAETTWPWSAYGAPSPGELGMVGIEGAELTCSYHINSFFNDYGASPCGDDDPTPNEWLVEVARRDGLAVLNHPGGSAKNDGLEWVMELYGNPANDHLVGMELSGGGGNDLHVALWDQLLGDFMPDRTIWGFGTSDMHFLVGTQFAFTVFLLDEPTEANVKEAMRAGQFYAVTGPGPVNLSRDRNRQDAFAPRAVYEGTYPELRSIVVNREAAEISIDASGYDEIVWISKPSTSEPSTDGDAAAPWPAAQVVQRGPVFNYSDSDAASPYVRAELIRHTDAGPIRVFINPFALIRSVAGNSEAEGLD
jgi:hypothetical protein